MRTSNERRRHQEALSGHVARREAKLRRDGFKRPVHHAQVEAEGERAANRRNGDTGARVTHQGNARQAQSHAYARAERSAEGRSNAAFFG